MRKPSIPVTLAYESLQKFAAVCVYQRYSQRAESPRVTRYQLDLAASCTHQGIRHSGEARAPWMTLTLK